LLAADSGGEERSLSQWNGGRKTWIKNAAALFNLGSARQKDTISQQQQQANKKMPVH
jgi:hypothetical protein